MSARKRFAIACVVCSSALVAVGTLAAAIETGSDAAVPAVSSRIRLAQAEPAYEMTPEDAAKVSPEVAAEGPPDFTEEYLHDAANIKAGEDVWMGLCTGCHGARAYPGKAPKLKPKKYTPEFVFHQATFGGKKMPPFGDVFTKEERMAVAAYVLSENFSP
jgi:mono/diheme cytochrome c family protein